MSNKTAKFFKKVSTSAILPIVAILMVVLSTIFLLLHVNVNKGQSIPATPAQVYFVGEYRIGDGQPQPIVKGEHIPATKGKVTLRGNFHYASPSGEYIGVFTGKTPIAFYTNHINLSFFEEGDSARYVIDNENPLLGESACGTGWTTHQFLRGGSTIEIVVYNPHDFGNENAIDQMLEKLSFWSGVNSEKEVLDAGSTQRNAGLIFMITAIMFLGTALLSSLIHVKNSQFIWMLGFAILVAGLYFIYSSFGISFWSDSVVLNTAVLGSSMMLYMFFLSTIVASFFQKTQKIAFISNTILGLSIITMMLLSTGKKLFFYDTWCIWAIIQCVANAVLTFCLIKEIIVAKGKRKLVYVGAFLPLVSFAVDALATWLGLWQGGLLSRYVFVALFVVAMVVLIRIIPQSINAIAKAKKLETEKLVLNTQLAESRVSTMMSQIRPHFIYNTLGSIEQLCELDPQKAGELVHNFAKYLRGNFGELDNPKPILMSQEMEHVHHYISIENVRFPDMTFSFEMNSTDFYIPALTIQPIVENAIKHGLMKLQKGGTIKVVSYETDQNYCITVEDDGVGFDTSVLLDERKHVGIRNIRGRLKAMVNGTLQIESTIGVGTKVVITIPKEAN